MENALAITSAALSALFEHSYPSPVDLLARSCALKWGTRTPCEELPGHFPPILSPLLSSNLLPSSISCWMVISTHSQLFTWHTFTGMERTNLQQLPPSLCPAWCKASAPENRVWTTAATLPAASWQGWVTEYQADSNSWKGTEIFLSHSSHNLNWYGRKRCTLVMVGCAWSIRKAVHIPRQ